MPVDDSLTLEYNEWPLLFGDVDSWVSNFYNQVIEHYRHNHADDYPQELKDHIYKEYNVVSAREVDGTFRLRFADEKSLTFFLLKFS